MTWEKYVCNRDKLVGEWVQATPVEKVVGVELRNADVHAFAKAATKAEKQSSLYGIRLEFEPDNPQDSNAIRVHGYAETKGWNGKVKQAEWHIGYLSAKLAVELQDDLISAGVPVSAELSGIYENDDQLEVYITVLAPKGLQLKAKDHRARTNGGTGESLRKKVSNLISTKDFDDAINLLLDCCDAEEANSRSKKQGVAPWCYETLAKLFRKMKLRDEEIAILERYQKQLKAPGIEPKKLGSRLEVLSSSESRSRKIS